MSVHYLGFGLNYPGTSNALAGCVNDANDCYAAVKPFAATRAKVLDNYADKAGALKALATFRNRFDEGDVGIITQSSHGTREKHQGKWVEAVVWADMELSYDYELDDEFLDFPPNCLLLFAGDFCNSGGASRSIVRPRGLNVTKCKTHPIDRPKGKRKLSYLYWAGCKADEFCYDAHFNGRPNGAFTYYMLKAMKELKPGSTYHDWFRLIAAKRPKGYLPSDEYPQTPQELGRAAMMKRKVPL